MIVALNEANNLTMRLELIKFYEMRFLVIEVQGTMAKSYMINFNLGKTSFNNYRTRIVERVGKLAMLNSDTIRSLLDNKFNYDSDILEIPDNYTGVWEVSFGHATIIVNQIIYLNSFLTTLLLILHTGIMMALNIA